MIKKVFVIPILILICYLSTALYSLHQLHIGIYYNKKTIIKEYVEWKEVRENLKNDLNIKLLKEIKKYEDFKKLGNFGVLFSTVTVKIIDNIINTYLNPDGISFLLNNNKKKIKNMSAPNIYTFLGGIKKMDFNGHSSFVIKQRFNQEEITVLFARKNLKWKIIEVKLPNNLYERLKNLS